MAHAAPPKWGLRAALPYLICRSSSCPLQESSFHGICDVYMVLRCTRNSCYHCENIGRAGRCIWLTESSCGHQEHKFWDDVGLPIGRRPEGGAKLLGGCLGEGSSKDAASRLLPTFS